MVSLVVVIYALQNGKYGKSLSKSAQFGLFTQALQEYAHLALTGAEEFLDKYSKVQVLVVSAVGTWFLFKICDFYENGDCK